MHIRDLFARQPATFSFEFFPPRSDEAADALFSSIAELSELRPSFVSVTYGAGGSTRELTRDLVLRLKAGTTLPPVPHVTCVAQGEAEIRGLVARYAAAGVSNIMALRGDRPRGGGNGAAGDAFAYAKDLVGFIRRIAGESGHPDPRGFGIGVAGYPEGHHETPNRLEEMDHLKAKVDAGADFIVTQLFFENRDFYDFRDRCALSGIRVPILAGIMPVTSIAGMLRMAELALGTRFPAPLIRALNRAGGDERAVRRIGVHWATEQCRDLLDHQVSGLHFYTLNRSTATREIYATLGVKDSLGLM